MFRFVAALAFVIVTAVVAEVPRPRAEVVVIDLSRTAVHTEVARSTSLLPFELSAVRLRAERSNRGGLQRSC